MTDSAQSKGLSRVAGMLAQLQDCWTLPNPMADERARYLTTRLLQLTRTEKARKEMSKQGSSGMDVILSTLQNTKDNQVIEGVLNIVLDLLTAPGSSLRARHLVMKGGSAVLLQTLMKLSQESLPCSESLILLHLILSKIGHKDKKFASKARTCGALSVTLSLFQRNIYNHCLSLPCLRVIKLYAACVLNATLMGKNGAIKTLFSLIGPFAGKYNALLKTVLETLGALLKSKTNVRQAVDHGNVRKLLDAYQDWHRHDVRHIHIAIRSGMLVCIKYITSINVGRVAFNDADGTEILYTTAQECLSNQALDRVVNLSTIIMRKCYPKNRLPLPTILSSIHFPLPTGASTCNADEEPEDGNEDSDEASLEQEVEPDDGTDIQEKDEDIETDLRNLRVQPKLDRSEEDLKVYQEFFSELFEDFQHLDKLEERGVCDIGLGNSLHTVTVPTAARDAYDHECAQTKTPYLGGMCQQPHETSSGERLEHILNVLDSCSLQESQNGDDVSNSFVINEKVLDDPTGHHKVKHLTPPCRDTGILDGDMHELSQLPGRCKETIERCYGHEDGTIMKWLLKCGRELPCHALQYAALSKDTKSVMDYSETAFPDFFGHTVPIEKEPLMQRQYGVQRSKIFKDIERLLFPEDVIDKVVYDLDDPGSLAHSEDALIFSSKFESGNLRKAIQIRKHEYDLITNSDINTTRHHLWFYFKVSNMECNVPYRLNLVNCEKVNSQFNFGMQPVMYSMRNALQEQQGWTRIGTDICYYRNSFYRSSAATGGQRGKSYYTLTFTVTFTYVDDICYFAYHYPYTYSSLMSHVQELASRIDPKKVYFRQETLCTSLGGNRCPVLTITAMPRSANHSDVQLFRNRPYVFLTARVHPGESNSSWVMHGILNFLLGSCPLAQSVQEAFVFKIVPMLNPDGVINGSYRCSLSGDDLNRQWNNPSLILHPIIYHTKGLLQYLSNLHHTPLLNVHPRDGTHIDDLRNIDDGTRIDASPCLRNTGMTFIAGSAFEPSPDWTAQRRVIFNQVFCDFHGHSRKKNIFLYGCSLNETLLQSKSKYQSSDMCEDRAYRKLPRILHKIAPAFCMNSCSFVVEKSKASTARVVVWRDIGVLRSYTMESTYCGCDQGPYKDQQIDTSKLEEMGTKFCLALLKLQRSMHSPEIGLAGSMALCDAIETIYKPSSKFHVLDNEPSCSSERVDYSDESQDEQDENEDETMAAAEDCLERLMEEFNDRGQ